MAGRKKGSVALTGLGQRWLRKFRQAGKWKFCSNESALSAQQEQRRKDTALYEHLLGLKSPWSVKSVDLSLADQRAVVEVVLKRGQVWADPTDKSKRAHINGWTERQWRHLVHAASRHRA
jgi:hypothetical protein